MKRVLVIDDDEGVRLSFRAALEQVGYAVTTVDNALSGLESARTETPDLIFLDLKMPRFTGVETLRTLSVVCPQTPVYVVTGFYGEFLEPLRQLQADGIDFNLARKPLSATEIQTIAAGRIGTLDPLTIGMGESRSRQGARA